jgi:hypothetical protein
MLDMAGVAYVKYDNPNHRQLVLDFGRFQAGSGAPNTAANTEVSSGPTSVDRRDSIL